MLSWNDITNYCQTIKEAIVKSGVKYDMIIGIQRGGIIPGVILSHMLDIPDYYSLGIRTTEFERCRKRLQSPIVKPNMLPDFTEKNVLVVDDVTNTGLTLRIAKQEILKRNPKLVTTISVVWDGMNSDKCPADIYSFYTPGWVCFPWE